MAVDTRDKRASCVGLDGHCCFLLPNPDAGAEDAGDRAQLAWKYRGLFDGGAPPPATSGWLILARRRARR